MASFDTKAAKSYLNYSLRQRLAMRSNLNGIDHTVSYYFIAALQPQAGYRKRLHHHHVLTIARSPTCLLQCWAVLNRDPGTPP
jgi:hypothetical protein